MIVFPWLFGMLILTLLAMLFLVAHGAFNNTVRKRRPRIVRPALRAVLILTSVELVIVLIWGLLVIPD